MTRRSTLFAAVLMLAAAAAVAEPGKISKEKISFEGKERVYFLFVPAGVAPERNLPLVIVIGTKDRIFPLDDVRATRDALKARGFPVEYFEMPGQTHMYLGSAKEINGKAWDLFQKNPLPAAPKYTVYRDPGK